MRYTTVLLFLIYFYTSPCSHSQAVLTWEQAIDSAEVCLNKYRIKDAIGLLDGILENDKTINDSIKAVVMAKLGVSYYYLNNLDSTHFYWNEALELRKNIFDSLHKDLGDSYYYMGSFYDIIGETDEAEDAFINALRIRKHNFGERNEKYAIALNGYGVLLMNQGRYTKAEEHFVQALDIFIEVLGPDHQHVIDIKSNLVLIYMWQRKYEQAMEHCRDLIREIEKKFGPDHRSLISNLNHMALMLTTYGEYLEAQELSERALRIIDKNGIKDKRILDQCYITLGKNFMNQELYEKAIPYYKLHLDIIKEKGNEKSLSYGFGLVELANCYLHLDSLERVEPIYQDALEIYRKIIDIGNTSSAYQIEAFCHRFYNYAPLNSLEFSYQAFQMRKRNLLFNAWEESEEDALRYGYYMRLTASHFLRYYFGLPDEIDYPIDRVCDVVITSKGQVSDILYERYRSLSAKPDKTVDSLFKELNRINYEISNLINESLDQKIDPALDEKLSKTITNKKEIESNLIQLSSTYKESYDQKEYDLDSLLTLFPDNAIIIEFMKWRGPDRKTDYYMGIAMSDREEKSCCNLGPVVEIDNVIKEYRYHIRTIENNGGLIDSTALADFKNISKRLHTLILEPFEKSIKPGDILFFVPDGDINLISMAGLVNKEGRYLIEDHPVAYLSSCRDILRYKNTRKDKKKLMIMADPDFDFGSGSTFPVSHIDSDRGPDKLTGFRDDCAYLKDIHINRLPGTKTEAEAIAGIWQHHGGELTVQCLDSLANEVNFKKNAGDFDVIHIATHGFYQPEECLENLEDNDSLDNALKDNKYSELLSGLILAGVNTREKNINRSEPDDGILTAAEITQLNLERVNMVVLSACESGLGEIISGEGVYGLRRAFLLAGANTVVSSLWKVSDKETISFMAFLYSKTDLPLYDVFREFQLNKLKRLRKYGYPDHPFSWGGFISIGAWK